MTHTGKTDETAGRNKNAWRILWQSAAAVAVLIVVSYLSFRQGSKQAGDQFADIRMETPYGSRVKTCLPDGTLVWLNAESNLTYSRSFGVNDRNVCLNGEAPNIVKELERNYDVKIILAHPDLEQLRYYGNFVKKELSIEEILDMLATTNKIKYSKNGKEITLSPK